MVRVDLTNGCKIIMYLKETPTLLLKNYILIDSEMLLINWTLLNFGL